MIGLLCRVEKLKLINKSGYLRFRINNKLMLVEEPHDEVYIKVVNGMSFLLALIYERFNFLKTKY